MAFSMSVSFNGVREAWSSSHTESSESNDEIDIYVDFLYFGKFSNQKKSKKKIRRKFEEKFEKKMFEFSRRDFEACKKDYGHLWTTEEWLLFNKIDFPFMDRSIIWVGISEPDLSLVRHQTVHGSPPVQDQSTNFGILGDPSLRGLVILVVVMALFEAEIFLINFEYGVIMIFD